MKKEFKSESKQLLNLMIHSIYSNKDIFLRELLSNASDALDKRSFEEIQSSNENKEEKKIQIIVNESSRKIIISDTGIGLDEDELELNLGTIAHSGSKDFINNIKEEEHDLDIIGQFGVGFYSSFIVSDNVEVISRKFNSENAYKFTSDGVSEYEISKSSLEFYGTQITLHIREGEEFDKYLDQNVIESLVKEHNDYVKYPIYLEKTIEEVNDNEETVIETKNEVINSRVAIWKKNKKDVSKEEYNDFYKSKFYDFTDPLMTIHSHAEGVQSLDILLFIPENKPFDYNSPTYKKGLDLYSKGILIDKNVEYLLPNHFSFVKGLVDSEDISLNISREMLQQDNTVERIKKSINSKIKKELLKLQKKDRDKYIKFFEEFGRTITFGVYEEFGRNKEDLKDLLMFKSSKTEELITLKEYVDNNEESDVIYYISGSSVEHIKNMPIMEKVKEKDLEILFLLNDIDEFAIQTLNEYDSKNFQSIVTANLDTDEEKEKIEEIKKDNSELIDSIKSNLGDDVSDVKFTTKLSKSLVNLVNEGDISIEQEKLLQMMPDNNFSAKKILEINPDHEVFKKLQSVYESDKESLNSISKLLYDQALLVNGLELEDPQEHAKLINELILKS